MKQLYPLLIVLISLFSFSVKGQQQYLQLNNSVNDIVESEIIQKGYNFHTSIKPYRINEINKIINVDSIYSSLYVHSKSRILRELLNSDSSNTIDLKHKDYITITGLLNATGGYNFSQKEKLTDLGIGLRLNGDIGKKLSFSADLFFDNSKYPDYLNNQINLTGVIPGEGKAYNSHLGYFYKTFTFYLSYSPSKYFNLEIGKGKNFWGDGYRSLLLSDNANSYPYFKFTTNFWKLKYVVLFAQLENIESTGLNLAENNERYAAMHYLSWNITRWCNLSFFEAVMFKGRDSTGRRGFEINYLNPVIIYRPVEYSLGSPDNDLMGSNLNFRIHRKNLVYFQLMLDEFVLSHVKARDGWWANKQAFQVGFKSFDVFRLKNLRLQAEFNYVRPFVYSHFDQGNTYSNFNQPLAIPLGANCKELVALINYRWHRWQLQMKYNFAVFGSDKPDSNYGQDIFKDYKTHTKEYDNFVGQGIRNTLHYRDLKISYTLNPKANLVVEAGVTNRSLRNYLYSQNDNIIYFGIKTLLDNQYFDF